jgi:demethylmenaquinone methyltransferase/2-methoxy-6-polyprenyl-1,4-benzoquinol methylase
MGSFEGADRARYVQEMFARIAPRYDLMNRIMTFGQDLRWRRAVIRRAAIPHGGWLLDLGAGTGDLVSTAFAQEHALHTVAADFTLEMMRIGRQRGDLGRAAGQSISWLGADASRLPFPDGRFDAVVSGFLLRNVVDLPRCLAEQLRVLKPGGMLVALDTTPPPDTALQPVLEFHLHTVIPTLGGWIAGQGEAYRYLPDSTESFLEPEQLADRLAVAGFQSVCFERRMFGTIAIHWGQKPLSEDKSA